MSDIQTITPAPVQTQVDPVAVAAAPVVVTETSPVILAPVVAPVAPVVAQETLLTPVAPAPVVTPNPAPAALVEPVAQTNTEGGQSVEPAPPPVYEPFKLPENVKVDNERIGEFTNILSALELKGKADHAITQEVGQQLLDFHVNELQKYTTEYNEYLQTTHNKQVVGWKDEFLADPVIGGANKDTTVTAALEFIRTHGGSEQEQQEFRSLMETTGIGNHKAMIRLLANAQIALKEGSPLAAQKPPIVAKSRVTTMYGNSSY